MPMHLRGGKCALRGAFLRWLVFTALLAVVLGLFWTEEITGYPSLRYLYPFPSLRYNAREVLSPLIVGPEIIVFRTVPVFQRWRGIDWLWVIPAALSAARLFLVFAWGVFRLRRGMRAPYAETLWLSAVCGYVAARMFSSAERPACDLAVLLLVTGIVVYVIQRRRPPAWTGVAPVQSDAGAKVEGTGDSRSGSSRKQ